MFIRKRKNRSGSYSVSVVDKSNGRYRELKIIGVSIDPHEIQKLCHQAQHWIDQYTGQMSIDSLLEDHQYEQSEIDETERVLSNVDNILINGTQLILNRVFNNIGFDELGDDILRDLVIARLCEPQSKSATVDYLKSYYDEDVELHQIYRYLDKLHSSQQEKIQQISVSHTRKILGGKIGIVFYDVTTLYFETDYGDELRQTGFSKDGKHSQPQVVLGLLVSKGGYPLAYSLFNGSQYEGRTMIPVVEDFVRRFELEDFVVVADSGLMNSTNIALLESEEYKYIIGARIKNEGSEIKRWILSLEKQDGRFYETVKAGSRLIVGYTDKRAKKDAYNREKGIRRLKQAFKSGKITKENINKRGYNKFLEISDNVKVDISQDKIVEDAKWDGFKGYITNTALSASDVYDQYSGLWEVERAYRITKGTLEMRPMFHFTPRRIEAHVCICFVAYKVYKELERILKLKDVGMSVDKVLSIAKTITTIRVKLSRSKRIYTKTMMLTNRHKLIAPMFNDDFWP